MTALIPEGGRKVVRLQSLPSRTTPRHALGPARHCVAPGRRAATMYLVTAANRSRALGRHRATPPRAIVHSGSAHACLNSYDRMLLWVAGALLSLRIAFVGERIIEGH